MSYNEINQGQLVEFATSISWSDTPRGKSLWLLAAGNLRERGVLVDAFADPIQIPDNLTDGPLRASLIDRFLVTFSYNDLADFQALKVEFKELMNQMVKPGNLKSR